MDEAREPSNPPGLQATPAQPGVGAPALPPAAAPEIEPPQAVDPGLWALMNVCKIVRKLLPLHPDFRKEKQELFQETLDTLDAFIPGMERLVRFQGRRSNSWGLTFIPLEGVNEDVPHFLHRPLEEHKGRHDKRSGGFRTLRWLDDVMANMRYLDLTDDATKELMRR